MNQRKPDPESEADRWRRAGAPAERPIDEIRPGQPGDPLAQLYDRKPDPEVERWPCRGGCGARIGMTAGAIAIVADQNRKLRARGEQPFRKRDVMICSNCMAREQRAKGQK